MRDDASPASGSESFGRFFRFLRPASAGREFPELREAGASWPDERQHVPFEAVCRLLSADPERTRETLLALETAHGREYFLRAVPTPDAEVRYYCDPDLPSSREAFGEACADLERPWEWISVEGAFALLWELAADGTPLRRDASVPDSSANRKRTKLLADTFGVFGARSTKSGSGTAASEARRE